jgi:hypothetical protein
VAMILAFCIFYEVMFHLRNVRANGPGSAMGRQLGV